MPSTKPHVLGLPFAFSGDRANSIAHKTFGGVNLVSASISDDLNGSVLGLAKFVLHRFPILSKVSSRTHAPAFNINNSLSDS